MVWVEWEKHVENDEFLVDILVIALGLDSGQFGVAPR
jgi:hypothetical protein